MPEEIDKTKGKQEKLPNSSTQEVKNNPSPIDQLVGLNNLLRSYKVVVIGLVVLAVGLGFSLILSMHRDPIVVLLKKDQKLFTHGKRAPITIDEKDVTDFVKKYLDLRYRWKEINPEVLSQNLAPLTTRGMNKKILNDLEMVKKGLKDKKASQSITNVEVKVEKESVVASFDKILNLEGVLIPISTLLKLQIIPGDRTNWNEIGLYINGVLESIAE